MDAELTALAESGAAVLVESMATDLWKGTKRAVLQLFGRGDRRARERIEAQLDDGSARVEAAERPDEARNDQVNFWVGQLVELLRRDPARREQLVQLIEDVGRALSGDRRAFQQTNEARDSGMVFAVQHGDQHAYLPPRP